MTISKIEAYRTSDGSLFYTKEVAEAYEQSGLFVKWCEKHLKEGWDGHACAIYILQFWNVSLK